MEKVDWHTSQIGDDTVITESYRNTQNVRNYFRARRGYDFKFDCSLMAWRRDGNFL